MQLIKMNSIKGICLISVLFLCPSLSSYGQSSDPFIPNQLLSLLPLTINRDSSGDIPNTNHTARVSDNRIYLFPANSDPDQENFDRREQHASLLDEGKNKKDEEDEKGSESLQSPPFFLSPSHSEDISYDDDQIPSPRNLGLSVPSNEVTSMDGYAALDTPKLSDVATPLSASIALVTNDNRSIISSSDDYSSNFYLRYLFELRRIEVLQADSYSRSFHYEALAEVQPLLAKENEV